MNLYLISQNENCGYDTYDSALVIAASEEEAKTIHPEGYRWENGKWRGGWAIDLAGQSWCNPDHITVKIIGTPTTGKIGDIIISSFNAG